MYDALADIERAHVTIHTMCSQVKFTRTLSDTSEHGKVHIAIVNTDAQYSLTNAHKGSHWFVMSCGTCPPRRMQSKPRRGVPLGGCTVGCTRSGRAISTSG